MNGTPTLSRTCPNCKKYGKVEFQANEEFHCPSCSAQWGKGPQNVFETCPVCECRHFYRHKDFSQALGCLVMAVGIVFVPWTYGMSLPILAGIDWFLYKKTPDLVICYRCLSEFRNFEIPTHIHGFSHALGDKYQEKGNGS